MPDQGGSSAREHAAGALDQQDERESNDRLHGRFWLKNLEPGFLYEDDHVLTSPAPPGAGAACIPCARGPKGTHHKGTCPSARVAPRTPSDA